jgi:hypothetical protein
MKLLNALRFFSLPAARGKIMIARSGVAERISIPWFFSWSKQRKSHEFFYQ